LNAGSHKESDVAVSDKYGGVFPAWREWRLSDKYPKYVPHQSGIDIEVLGLKQTRNCGRNLGHKTSASEVQTNFQRWLFIEDWVAKTDCRSRSWSDTMVAR
jgi:hypothetical protein